jgi:hypothetical protein
MADESGPADLGTTGGVVWADREEWARRLTPAGCIIRKSGAPLDVIAEFQGSWATAPDRVPLAGYICMLRANLSVMALRSSSADSLSRSLRSQVR